MNLPLRKQSTEVPADHLSAKNDPQHQIDTQSTDRSVNRNDNTRSDSSQPKKYQVDFEGSGSEYFKIWIVNILLTIVTLYIYSAWAKVRSKRYFYGNTTINGHPFEYHATGKQLIVGRLITFALVIASVIIQNFYPLAAMAMWAVFALAFPWLLWRSMKFNAKVSSFRNIRFGFNGKLRTPYWIMLGLPLLLLTIIAASVAATVYFVGDLQTSPVAMAAISSLVVIIMLTAGPWLHKLIIEYSHNNHRWGTSEFQADIRKRSIFWIHFSSMLLYVGLIGLVVAAVFAASKAIGEDPLQNLFASGAAGSMEQTAIIIALYATLILIGSFIGAYYSASVRNYRYNQTNIGGRASIHSNVKTFPLWWLNVSNMFLIVATLGLAFPWTKVRSARFYARNTTLTVIGGLDGFAGQEEGRVKAMGEELADGFDIEMNIGV